MNNFTYSRIPSKLLITLTPVIIPRYYYLFVIPKSKKNFFPSKQLAQRLPSSHLGAVSGRMPAAAPRKVKFAHDNAANFSRKSGGTVCARSSSPSFYGALRLLRFLSYSRLPPRWTGRGRGIGEKRIYTSRG